MTPELDINAMLDAMKATIKAQLSAVAMVDDYWRLQLTLDVPAVGLCVSGIEPCESGDLGTEQFAAYIEISAYCVVTYKAAGGHKAKRNAASLAGAVAALVKAQTWGVPVRLAEDIHATPDVWPQKSEEYECWRVDWKHACLLGSSIWDDDGPAVQEIFIGIAPNIGPMHIDDYRLICPDKIPAEKVIYTDAGTGFTYAFQMANGSAHLARVQPPAGAINGANVAFCNASDASLYVLQVTNGQPVFAQVAYRDSLIDGDRVIFSSNGNKYRMRIGGGQPVFYIAL